MVLFCFCLVLYFWCRVLLFSLGWLGTHCVAKLPQLFKCWGYSHEPNRPTLRWYFDKYVCVIDSLFLWFLLSFTTDIDTEKRTKSQHFAHFIRGTPLVIRWAAGHEGEPFVSSFFSSPRTRVCFRIVYYIDCLVCSHSLSESSGPNYYSTGYAPILAQEESGATCDDSEAWNFHLQSVSWGCILTTSMGILIKW